MYTNKRKNISISSAEDIGKKKKQSYLGPDQASTSNCPIPTPVPSATTSSICHNISTVTETNKKEKNRSSSPVSMCCEDKESEAVASTSGFSNDQKDEKMKGK